MKKLIALILLCLLMFAEYRIIMHNIQPSWGEDGFLHLEVFGCVDTYYVEEGTP
jgi:hypothetical protein